MKIVAPFSSPDEVPMLVHNGADELYCGVTTPEWLQHFQELWWMNRRSPGQANLTSWPELTEAVSRAHEARAPVFLTMNAPFYPQGSIGYVLRLMEKLLEQAEVDGFIISDLNLLLQVSEARLPARLHLSSLAGCINAASVEFYRELGVSRIILPRQLRLSEIETLAARAGDLMELEVFAVNDGCFFDEGICQTSHAFGPFCLTDWQAGTWRVNDQGPSPEELNRQFEHLKEYLWYLNNCGSTFQEHGLPNGPCSLCWFAQMRDWGIEAVKIVGREGSFQRKMGSIQLVKAVMDLVRQGGSPQETAALARRLRATSRYCDSGYMCYFRDL